MFPNKDCKDCPPCPPIVPAVPIPDLSHICAGEYDLSCIKYTGPDIPCLEIFTGTMMDVVLQKFNTALAVCDCCYIPPIPNIDCVVSDWSDWSPCNCVPAGAGSECTQTRTRTILTPSSGDGIVCPALSETRTTCCVVNCAGAYTYTTCAANGTRTGTFVITTQPSCGGTPCPPTTITDPCIPNINCVLQWSDWGPCTSGYERRTATVIIPASGTGTPCGPLEETRSGCTPPPNCEPVSNVHSKVINLCYQFVHTIESYNCDCTPTGILSTLRNNERLTVDSFYYDSISNTIFKVKTYDSCNSDLITDRNISPSAGKVNCADIVCSCVRPEGLHTAKVLSFFRTPAGTGCPATNYSIRTAADNAAACAMFAKLKQCGCTATPLVQANSTVIQYMEPLTIGQTAWKDTNINDCNVTLDGKYFLLDDMNKTVQEYFCPLSSIKIITVAGGLITDIYNCTYP